MVVGRSMRVDLILNHHDVVGFLSILEGNLTKHFLPKRTTSFNTNIRTIVPVTGTCLKNIPTKAPEMTLLGDCLHFTVGTYHRLFPDVEVSDFLSKQENLENNPSLSRDLEENRYKAYIMLVPWILLLTRAAAIVKGTITDDKVISSQEIYHPVSSN